MKLRFIANELFSPSVLFKAKFYCAQKFSVENGKKSESDFVLTIKALSNVVTIIRYIKKNERTMDIYNYRIT